MDKIIMIEFLIGPLILVLAIIFRSFPPKSINGVYGYRTPLSMKSQQTWDEANRYSINLMILVGIIVTLTQIVLHFTIEGHSKVIISVILLTVLLIALIPITEAHLRKNFDQDGNPKNG